MGLGPNAGLLLWLLWLLWLLLLLLPPALHRSAERTIGLNMPLLLSLPSGPTVCGAGASTLRCGLVPLPLPLLPPGRAKEVGSERE